MSAPVEMGTCCDGAFVFTLLGWVDGTDASEELPRLPRAAQYELGTMAGEALRQIHTLTGDLDGQTWDAHYSAKVDRVLANYEACPVKLSYGAEVIRFVRAELSRLRGRPITLQHGDFHVGSLIVTPDREIAVIDFNRCSCGDPWAEYDRYVFTWRTSKDFATGQVDGYFGSDIPDEFFPLLALYNGVNMLGSIPWALPFGDAEVKLMVDNAEAVYGSYDGFRSCAPKWYDQNR